MSILAADISKANPGWMSTRTRRHKQFRNQAASVENSQASFLSKSQKC